MLPFLKKSKEASVSAPVDVEKRKPDNEESEDYDYLHSASEDLINAVHSKDIPAVAEALRAAFQICDSDPHEEGEHLEGEE